MPAEWAPQSAIMLTWPHPGTDWSDILADVEPVFMEIARTVLRFQHVLLSCEHVVRLQELERDLNQFAQDNGLPGRVAAVPAPANDTWHATTAP